MKEYYWFSFSYKGENQGVCLVKANTFEESLKKVIDLKIAPNHDHIQCFGISEPELPLDVLITPDKLRELGYTPVKSKI